MALIRTAKYGTNATINVPLLTEDPFPSSVNMYIQNDAYNEFTLDHFFDRTINFNVAGTGYTSFGYSHQNAIPEMLGGIVNIRGEVTHVRHQIFNTNNDWRNNLDQAPFASMDPTRPIIQSRFETDGTNNCSLITYNFQASNMGATGYIWYLRKVNSTSDFSFGAPLQNTNLTTAFSGFPIYRNPSTNNLIYIANNHVSNYTPGSACAAMTNIFSAVAPTFNTVTTTSGTRCNQFLGVSSADGTAIFFNNDIGNDFTQNIFKYNDTNNTSTTLATFSTAPASAGAYNSGGSRTSPTGGTFSPKFSTRTFTDPNNGQTAWYTPFFDTTGNIAPLYFNWNRSNDTFTRFANVTTTYTTGAQSTFYAADTVTSSGVNVGTGMQKIHVVESFVFSGTRYVTLMQLHGAGGIYDTNALQRTFMTYSIQGNDYTKMTFHTAATIPATPKNIVWLNDARTLLGVITHNFFYVYSFGGTAGNAALGWSQTASFNYQFNAVGRDSLGRIWAAENGPLNGGRLHILSGSVPTTVTVTPAANSYNYSGTTLSTTYNVDAFDITGARIAANVTLTANGSSIRFFTNNIAVTTSTISVFTSNSATTVVNAAVVNSGTSTISTTVTL